LQPRLQLLLDDHCERHDKLQRLRRDDWGCRRIGTPVPKEAERHSGMIVNTIGPRATLASRLCWKVFGFVK